MFVFVGKWNEMNSWSKDFRFMKVFGGLEVMGDWRAGRVLLRFLKFDFTILS